MREKERKIERDPTNPSGTSLYTPLKVGICAPCGYIGHLHRKVPEILVGSFSNGHICRHHECIKVTFAKCLSLWSTSFQIRPHKDTHNCNLKTLVGHQIHVFTLQFNNPTWCHWELQLQHLPLKGHDGYLCVPQM